jgi:transcription initiation factor TFIIE subunit alpha
MGVTKKHIEYVVTELVGDEALPFVFYIKGKKHISEFIIAEELDEEIHKTRNILYRLFEHNIVTFTRKKDRIKGWYICYWDFNEKIIPYLLQKIRQGKIEKLSERLQKEQENAFYLCRNACTRMSFEAAIESNFKCPECSEVMHEQNNQRTIEFIKEKIKELKVAKA